jgi:uncharacterized phage protein (TIGR01671 family)
MRGFRVYDKQEKKMINDPCMENLFIAGNGNIVDVKHFDHYLIDRYVRMDSIGRWDKNKNEIFEGDILLADYDYCEEENVHLEVKWDDSRASFYLSDISDGVAEDNDEFDLINQCYQVIGNIWENSELLKEQ